MVSSRIWKSNERAKKCKKNGNLGIFEQWIYDKSNDEFVSGILESKKLRDELQSIPYNSNKTAWDKFIDAFMDILGLKQDNLLREALNTIFTNINSNGINEKYNKNFQKLSTS